MNYCSVIQDRYFLRIHLQPFLIGLSFLKNWVDGGGPPAPFLCCCAFGAVSFGARACKSLGAAHSYHGGKKGTRILLKLVRMRFLFGSHCKIHVTLRYLSGFPVLSVRGESHFQVIAVYDRHMMQGGSALFRDVSCLQSVAIDLERNTRLEYAAAALAAAAFPWAAEMLACKT